MKKTQILDTDDIKLDFEEERKDLNKATEESAE